MKTRWLIPALILGLALAAAPLTRAVSDGAETEKIARLIDQLASMKFAQRHKASRELEAIGTPALAALRKAINSADMETSHRARELVARIEKKLETAAVLAPTRVRLVCKDMPVIAAVAELAKKANVKLQVEPNSVAKVAQRKLTLDTGEVTFWEALDKLCAHAGLVETTGQNLNVYTAPNINIQGWAPAQPLIRPQAFPKGVLPVKPAVNPQKQKGFQFQPVNPAPAQRVQFQLQQLQQLQLQQLQAQRIQLQLQQRIQVIRGNDLIWESMGGVQDNGQIFLADGKPETVPTCYAGAFRIRARTAAGKDKQSAAITLEVTPEPRHLGWSVVGNPRLDKAADERGQAVTLVLQEEPRRQLDPELLRFQARRMAILADTGATVPSSPLKKTISMKIKLGEIPGGVLKEIQGHFTVQTRTELEDLIVVNDILKASGKTTKGTRGGSIQVLDVGKDQNGNHQIRFKLEDPTGFNGDGAADFLVARGRVVRIWNAAGRMGAVTTAPGGNSSVSLRDAKGVAFTMIGSSVQGNNGDLVQTLTFQAQNGREPAKLVCSGRRTVAVDVPFTFKDLKLP
jgi:hypothetical protein